MVNVPVSKRHSTKVFFVLRSVSVVFALVVVGCVPGKTQDLKWRERAEIDRARAGYMAGVIRGKYVIAGGSYWADGKKVWTDEVNLYDPVENSWTKGAPLPSPRSDGANVVLDDALYIFGGGAYGTIQQDAIVYQDGKWRALPSAKLPVPLLYSIAVADHGLIYVVGGLSKYEDYSHLRNEMWVWNPKKAASGWKKVTSFPGPGLITEAVAALNGKIYVLGGAKTGGKDVVNVNTAFEYDPTADQWKTLPPLPVERRCWWGLPVNNEILLFGGYTTKNESDVFVYRPDGDLKATTSMPHGLCDAKFFRIGNAVYGVGGEAAPMIRGKWTLEADLLTSHDQNGR